MQLDVLAASHIIGIGRGVDVQSSILTSLTGDKVCLSVVGEQALSIDGEAGGGLGSGITLELGGRCYRYLLERCLSVKKRIWILTGQDASTSVTIDDTAIGVDAVLALRKVAVDTVLSIIKLANGTRGTARRGQMEAARVVSGDESIGSDSESRESGKVLHSVRANEGGEVAQWVKRMDKRVDWSELIGLRHNVVYLLSV
jgi:hypothetical protein